MSLHALSPVAHLWRYVMDCTHAKAWLPCCWKHPGDLLEISAAELLYSSTTSLLLWDPPSQRLSVGHKPAEQGKWRRRRGEWPHTSHTWCSDTQAKSVLQLYTEFFASFFFISYFEMEEQKKMLPRGCEKMLFLCLNEVTKFSRSITAAFFRQIHTLPLANRQKVSCAILNASWYRKAKLIKVSACRRHWLFTHHTPTWSFCRNTYSCLQASRLPDTDSSQTPPRSSFGIDWF